MAIQYTLTTQADPFKRAKNILHQLTQSLKSGVWLQAEHGDVEKMIQLEGMEILRLLLQGHLDERARREPSLRSVMYAGGEHDYRRDSCIRQLRSIFGTVKAGRKGYSLEGTDSVFPQDAQLNLSKDSYSDGLRRHAAGVVADLSFEKSTMKIAEFTASGVPKRQIENITRHLSRDFDDFYATRQFEVPGENGLLVLSCDGKGIVMRQEDLREATRMAAQKASHKKQTRLSRGEKRNRKRMATVAAVYGIDPHIRSAESIIGNQGPKHSPPKPRNKRVWASVEKPSLDVIRGMFEEAVRRDPEKKRKWVVLVDGQDTQLKEIKKVMKEFDVRADLVVDFVHVLEYLWKAAYCFHEESSQEAEKWVQERALRILEGEASTVAAGIRRSATKRRLRKKQRAGADRCAGYLLKKKSFLRYDKALKRGFPIATGVIEGACRYLVKDRLDITGARWGLEGAEAVLKIRALKSSKDFEEYFTFHKQRERLRNYPFYESISYKMAA